MPHEVGGRADKHGNRYEVRWVIHQLLDILAEKLDYIVVEALGDDEIGADVWVSYKDGSRECQQCKSRSGSNEYWDFGTANSKGNFAKWEAQLIRN